MSSLRVCSLLLAIAAATIGVAEAKFCGDDIDGVRVACACGDVVASDTVLQVGDPVVSSRCDVHGLAVRAANTAESISLNLNGLSIVGKGRGFGLKIDRGGSSGAVIVGGYSPRLGEVVGFAYGVLVAKPNTLARLERIISKGNSYQGFLIRQAGAVIQDIVAERNGGNGIHILGSGGRFLGLRADENAYKGITINSPGAIVSGTADSNGRHGIAVPAPRSELVNVAAHGNDGDGIRTRWPSQKLRNIDSSGNADAQVRDLSATAKRMAR